MPGYELYAKEDFYPQLLEVLNGAENCLILELEPTENKNNHPPAGLIIRGEILRKSQNGPYSLDGDMLVIQGNNSYMLNDVIPIRTDFSPRALMFHSVYLSGNVTNRQYFPDGSKTVIVLPINDLEELRVNILNILENDGTKNRLITRLSELLNLGLDNEKLVNLYTRLLNFFQDRRFYNSIESVINN